MVGNDVVDLEDSETTPIATHPRFDERVFATEELAWLARSRAAERLRWVLWAAKESAFKAAKKLDPRTTFSPRRLVVHLDSEEAGSVRLGRRIFSLRILTDRQACHAVACADLPRGVLVVSGLRRLAAEDRGGAPMRPRRAARRLAIDALAPWLEARTQDLEVVREGRVPRLWLRGRPVAVDLSLSHHGRFVAFACALDPSTRFVE